MQDEQRNESQQFDLIRFISNSLRFLRRTFWLVLLAGVLGALLMAFYTHKVYSPKYECHAVLSVRVDNSSITDVIGSGDKTSSTYTHQLVTTFPTIITSDSMRERIMRELGTNSINGTITPKVIADSSLFTLTVRSSNPEDAYNILNAVIKCYPDMAFIYIGAASITLIEAPVMPTEPVKAMKIARPTLLGALVGALIMLAILCLLAQLQTVVTSSSDLQRYTNVPCIVHVPQTELKRRAQGTNQLSLRNEHLPQVYEEAIRVLGARVLRQCREQSIRRICITSTVPGEGKSTIAANLAMTLARSGLRIILIDADLRTQELREFFGIEGEPRGMKELLQDPNLDIQSCLTQVPGTDVRLLCGNRVDRPVTLLRRSRLGALLERLDEQADLILIDTPPIGLLTDAAAFAQHSDAAIYVVRAGATAGNRIADGMQAVSDCRTKILGYVLNGVSAKSGGHGYGYRYSYGYGYGSRYGAGYGSSYGSSYRSSYSHYGNNYGHYGSYGGYGGYGGYEDYKPDSASDAQKKAEKNRKQKKTAERTAQDKSAQTQDKPIQERKTDETPRRRTESRGASSERRRERTGSSGQTRRPAPVTQTPSSQPAPETPSSQPVQDTLLRRPESETTDRQPEPVRTLPPLQFEPVSETPAVRSVPEVPGETGAAYDDPELEAIVREVLASTTEEDVRRAYETVEAETAAHRAAAEARKPGQDRAEAQKSQKHRGPFGKSK